MFDYTIEIWRRSRWFGWKKLTAFSPAGFGGALLNVNMFFQWDESSHQNQDLVSSQGGDNPEIVV